VAISCFCAAFGSPGAIIIHIVHMENRRSILSSILSARSPWRPLNKSQWAGWHVGGIPRKA